MSHAQRVGSAALGLILLLVMTMTAVAQDQPPAAQPVPEAGQAMVRFLHAAPNAEIGGVVLSAGEEQAQVEQFAGIAYGEMSDYVPIPEGGYEVIVDLAVVEGEQADGTVEVPADSLDTFAGEYYTIALIGLVQPEEGQEGGFVEWLQGLFTNEDDAFTLRAKVINDMAPFAVNDGQAEIRLAHLAPGTEAIELVQLDDEGANSIHSVGYGEVSGFNQLDPAAGQLELRVAGSEAAILDLADLQLEPGSSQTLYLIGTPVEEVPLQPIVVPNPAQASLAATPATPGAAPVASTDMTFYRDTLNEIEARIAEIEGRLDQLLQIEGAQEEATAALEQVEEAYALLEQARDRLAAQPAAVPAVPADPAAPASEDADGDGN